jgi:hypothetical protein
MTISFRQLNRRKGRKGRKGERGSILLEALIASAILTLVAATIAPLFIRHLELAKRTRDLNMIEAIVNRDINTFRHFSRFWKAFSGPYSSDLMRNEITLTTPSSQNNSQRPMTYAAGEYCFTWEDKKKDYLEKSMSTDIAAYGASMPGGIDLIPDTGLSYRTLAVLPGYEVRRYMASVSLTGVNANAIRLSYLVVATSSNSPPLPFTRFAEIPIEAQFWC